MPPTPPTAAPATPRADTLAAGFIPTLTHANVHSWAAGVRCFLLVMDAGGILDRRDTEPGRRSSAAVPPAHAVLARAPLPAASLRSDESTRVQPSSSPVVDAGAPRIHFLPATPAAPARAASSPTTPTTMNAHAEACAHVSALDSDSDDEQDDERDEAQCAEAPHATTTAPISDAPEIAGDHMPSGSGATPLVTTLAVRQAAWTAWAAKEGKARRVIRATVHAGDYAEIARLWCAFDQYTYLLRKYAAGGGGGMA